jgi:hypothetical protein
VVFTPLLDERALGVLTDLRQRGFPVIVVDVLRHEPPAEPRDGVLRLRDCLIAPKAQRGLPAISGQSCKELWRRLPTGSPSLEKGSPPPAGRRATPLAGRSFRTMSAGWPVSSSMWCRPIPQSW